MHDAAADNLTDAWLSLLLATVCFVAAVVVGGCATWPDGFKTSLSIQAPPWASIKWSAGVLTQGTSTTAPAEK